MLRPVRTLFLLLLAVIIAGCGFHLRGTVSKPLPYKTIHIALPETSEVYLWLERYIKAQGTTEVVADPKSAEAVFQQLQDNRVKSILSVNAQGLVREYRLQRTFTFRVVTPQGQTLVPVNEITLTRDISFDASNVLAKDMEENLLWRDMTTEIVNQVMRRLSLIKPRVPGQDDED